MATNVTYSNLETLTLNTGESYTTCTFSNIGTINIVGANSFSGCIFSGVGRVSGTTSITLTSGSYANITFDLPTAAITLAGTPSIGANVNWNSSVLYIGASSFTQTGGYAKGYISSSGTGTLTFTGTAINAYVEGYSSRQVVLNNCEVNGILRGYCTLNNCNSNKEITIEVSTSVYIYGGVYSQIVATFTPGATEIIPDKLRTSRYSGTLQGGTLTLAENFLDKMVIPATATNNIFLNAKGLDFRKYAANMSNVNTFRSPVNCVFPDKYPTFLEGFVSGCQFCGPVILGGPVNTQITLQDSSFPFMYIPTYDGNTAVNLGKGNSFAGSILYFPLRAAVKNSFREANVTNIQPYNIFTDCDFRGARFSGGNLDGCTFIRCDISGVTYDIPNTATYTDCTSGSYSVGENLAGPAWSTFNGALTLSKTLQPGEALAVAFPYNTEYPLSGGAFDVYHIPLFVAESISRGMSRIDGGVMAASAFSTEDLKLMSSRYSINVTSIFNYNQMTSGAKSLALIRNPYSTAKTLKLGNTVDLAASFNAWGGSGDSSTISLASNEYAGWSASLTTSGVEVFSSLTNHTAWIITAGAITSLAARFSNSKGDPTVTDSLLDSYASLKIDGLYGRVYSQTGSTSTHYIIVKNTSGVSASARITSTQPSALPNTWVVDADTLAYYNFTGIKSEASSVADLSGNGRNMTLAAASGTVSRVNYGFKLHNAYGVYASGLSSVFTGSNFRIDAKLILDSTSQGVGVNSQFFGEYNPTDFLNGGFFYRHNWDLYWQSGVRGTSGETHVFPYSNLSGEVIVSLVCNYAVGATTVQVYINNVLRATHTVNGGDILWAAGSQFLLGGLGTNASNGYLKGTIRDLSIRRVTTIATV
jgi:hypothetical protein